MIYDEGWDNHDDVDDEEQQQQQQPITNSQNIVHTESSNINDQKLIISQEINQFPIKKKDYDFLYNHVVNQIFGNHHFKYNLLKGSRLVRSVDEDSRQITISTMYGEVDSSVCELIRSAANIHSRDRFLDIGHGIGSVCIYMATVCNCEVVGCEMENSRYEISLLLRSSFDALLDRIQSPDQKLSHLVRFINADFKKTENLIQRSSVVYFNDFGHLTIQPQLRNFFYETISQLVDGSHVFVFEPLQSKGFELIKCYKLPKGACSWTNAALELMHYTRNREKDKTTSKTSCRLRKGQNSKYESYY